MCKALCDSNLMCRKPEIICYTGREYSEKCCILDYYAWVEPGIAMDLAAMFCSGIIGFIILFVIEFKLLTNMIFNTEYSLKRIPKEKRETLDPEVWAEKLRVRSLHKAQIGEYGLVAKDLCKFYQEHFAVKRLCLTVRE